MANPKFDETEPVSFDETESLDTPKFEETSDIQEPSRITESFLGGAFQDLSVGILDEVKGALEAAGQSVGIKGLGQEFGKQEFQEPIGLDTEKLLDVYKQGRDLERKRIEELKQDSPTAYTAGEVTGMVGPAIASGGAGLVKNLLKSGTKQATKVAGETTAKQALKLGATGAGMGALGSAGYSETEALEQPLELAKEMAEGAALSGGLSMAIPSLAKGGKNIAKYTANKIKQGSKYVLEAGLGLDKGGIDYVIRNFDKIKNVVDYPEIREKLLKISKNASKMVSNLTQSAKKIIDTEQGRKKTIPKQILIEKLEKQIADIGGQADDSSVKEIKKVIDLIKGQQLKQEPLNDALQKINEKINTEVTKANKLGYQANFQAPEWDLEKGIVTIMGIVDDKPQVIQQKIKPLGKNVSKYEGDLLSLQDLHEIVTETGKMLKGKGADFDNVVPALKQTYGDLSETLKELVPDKNFRKLMGEIHEGINKVNSFDKYFKLDHNVPKGAIEEITPSIKQIQKYEKNIGLETKDLDPERYLKDIEEYVGVQPYDKVEDLVKQRRFKGLIEGGHDYTATGGSDIKSKVRGLSAKPLLKKGLEFASDQYKKGTSKKISNFVDKATVATTVPLTAGAIQTGAKVATNDNKLSTKLNDSSNLENLIQEFEASGKPAQQNYAEQLKKYQESDNEQDKLQMRYSLQQQPAFRKLLDEYDKLKDK